MDKFSWIKQVISSNCISGKELTIAGKENPACILALESDDKNINRREWDVKTKDALFLTNDQNNKRGWQSSRVLSETV